MYSVIIIDDEKVFVKNICEVIDFAALDLQLAAIAHNGIEGYEKIKKLLPDIIICDIEMPQMDGFEMLEKVKTIPGYKPQIIMFTGFNEFKYAKKAISLHVIDYLVKPCFPNELISALTVAKSACDESRLNTSIEFSYNETQIMIFINDIIHRNSYGTVELMEKQHKLGISLKAEQYCLLRMHFTGGASDDSSANAENIRVVGNEITNKIINSFDRCFHTSFNSDHIYFLILGPNSTKQITDTCNAILTETKSNFNAFISVSSFCSAVVDLPGLLSQVKYCAKFSFCFESDKVLVYSIIRPYIKTMFKNDSFVKYENDLKSNAVLGLDNINKYINSIKIYAANIEYYDPDYFKPMIYHTMTALISGFFNFSQTGEPDEKSELWAEIAKTESISELIALCTLVLSKFNNMHGISLEARYNFISEQITEYVQKNYMNTISSIELAKQFYMSDRRLRDIFYSVKNMTLNDYIRIYRMQKAFELLKTTNLTVQEICKKVGYSNTLRFRQAFTEFYGKSPSEYFKKRDKK